MSNWKRKLTSRKLWVSVAGFVGMMVTALGGTDSQVTQVTALVMAGAAVVGYVLGEGLADASSAGIKVEEGILLEADTISKEGEE